MAADVPDGFRRSGRRIQIHGAAFQFVETRQLNGSAVHWKTRMNITLDPDEA
jgi:hypothetical protein